MAEATKVFQSMSGTDIHAVFNDVIFGELQMVSYKVDREKAPVYTMGSVDPRSIARGKRLISGACVFVTFDRDSLLSTMNDPANNVPQPYLNKADVANMKASTADRGRATGVNGGSVGVTGSGLNYDFNEQAKALLGDQLMPFNITLVGASEYGLVSKMTIFGVELMTEAGGVSIDDLTLESQMSFIAKGISKWEPVSRSSGLASQISQVQAQL